MTDYMRNDERRLVSVFRSKSRPDMYLYVDRQEGLARVPEALSQLFGTPVPAMDLLLTPEKRMARFSAADILAGIRDQGFFLQMPPLPDEEMNAIIRANDKLASGRRLP